jgi:hypothetical protein
MGFSKIVKLTSVLGGVAIFVNNLFESTEIHIHSLLEIITVSIHLKILLCICNIYQPDSTNLLLNDLYDIIKQLSKPFFFSTILIAESKSGDPTTLILEAERWKNS